MFYYNSPVGTFRIDRQDEDSYRLSIDGLDLGTYGSPGEAARVVYNQSTGFESWDVLGFVHAPSDIGEWDMD
jgi:hypothetical protein